MKLIIAGSRTLNLSEGFIHEMFIYFDLYQFVDIIISGGATGVDSAAIDFGEEYRILVKIFNADWTKDGKAAGPIRNKKMAEFADALLLIWDGESRGSRNMKEEMKKLNKPIYEVILNRAT